MDCNGRNWNRSLISELFTSQEQASILSIKDLDPYKEYQLIWEKEKNGNFSVSSIYAALIEEKWNNLDLPEPSSHHQVNKHARKKLWSLQIKGKIKHFLWRGINNTIPICYNLRRRGLELDPICQICWEAPETQEHLFFQCHRAAKIWKLSPVSWDGLQNDADCFKTWWRRICSIPAGRLSTKRIQITAYLLWEI
ncbi:Unknown protein [Striga hermonthica]|uniref:Reverse transcriptase zinc-binding domain-containing protein n=1 Tax=Striga hermonthica TaxID=68872 RepID=A0A9N7P0N4_STRHE|nr:Unknown protein [Striga hermonthica]